LSVLYCGQARLLKLFTPCLLWLQLRQDHNSSYAHNPFLYIRWDRELRRFQPRSYSRPKAERYRNTDDFEGRDRLHSLRHLLSKPRRCLRIFSRHCLLSVTSETLILFENLQIICAFAFGYIHQYQQHHDLAVRPSLAIFTNHSMSIIAAS